MAPAASPVGQCALVMRTALARMPGYATLEQVVDASRFHGRRVRLRAAVRVTTSDEEGGAELFLQAEDAQLKSLAASAMLGKRIRSPQWATYETVLDVPANTVALRFGLAVMPCPSRSRDRSRRSPLPPFANEKTSS